MIRTLALNPDDIGSSDELGIMRNLSRERIEDDLQKDYLFWIDIVDIENDELDWIASLFNIHPNIIEDIRRIDNRPTIKNYTNYLFLRLIQPGLDRNAVQSKEIHCLLGDNFLLTIRAEASTTVDKAYTHVSRNIKSWEKGASYFLLLTIQQIVDSYYPLLDRISNRIDVIEQRLLVGDWEKHDRNSLHRIKQELIALKQMVAPQREVLSSVISSEQIINMQQNVDLFHHMYERLIRVYDVIDSLRELSSNVLDMYHSHESKRLVDAVNRLTIFSMIFLPLTFFTGLFELNFATTSDQMVIPISGTFLFIAIIFLMILSVGTMLILFRKQRWL